MIGTFYKQAFNRKKYMKKKSQTNMLWTYGLGCVDQQIVPNTIYDVMTICTCTYH